MSGLNETQCYYCNAAIPADALNCPSCGKERNELYKLREKHRFGVILGLAVMLGSFWLWKNDYTFRRGLENGSLEAIGLTAFLVLMVLVFASLAWYSRSRYAQISGKQMTGF